MKKILTVVAIAVVSGFSASALQYTDVDAIGATVSVGTPYVGNFDISAGDGGLGDVAGYNPLTQTLISAVAGFTFLDVNLTPNTVSIQLDGQSLIAGGIIDQVLTSFNGAVVGNAYLTLNATGSIDYRVELLSGSPVVLVMAGLTAQAADKVIAVPDGGMTLSLLGCGLLAGSWVCRRLRISRIVR